MVVLESHPARMAGVWGCRIIGRACPAGRARYARGGNSVADRGLRRGASVGRERDVVHDQREGRAEGSKKACKHPLHA